MNIPTDIQVMIQSVLVIDGIVIDEMKSRERGRGSRSMISDDGRVEVQFEWQGS
jgi:hypothetical protein